MCVCVVGGHNQGAERKVFWVFLHQSNSTISIRGANAVFPGLSVTEDEVQSRQQLPRCAKAFTT